MTPSPDQVDLDPPLHHVNESPCAEHDCDWATELGEAFCVRHGGGEMVEALREGRP